MAKRTEGTLDSMKVEYIAAKLGHTLADVHAIEEVAQNVARVAGVMGYEGVGCSNLGYQRPYWLVVWDVETTRARWAKPGQLGQMDFVMKWIEPTAEQLVCCCQAHTAGGEK